MRRVSGHTSWESNRAAITRYRVAITLGMLCYIAGVAHASLQPGPRLWGIHLPGFLPIAAKFGLFAGLLGALVLMLAGAILGARGTIAEGPQRANGSEKLNGRWHLVGFIGLSGFLLWLLRARTHFLGDGALWLSGLQKGEQLPGHEPLAEAIWLAVADALRSAGAEITASTVAPLSIACGLVAAAATWELAREASSGTGRFGVALALLATLGSSALFFGYIESYPPVAATILWFLYSGIRSSRAGSAPLLPAALLSVAIAAHLACVYLVPAYIYLVGRARLNVTGKLFHLLVPLCLTTALLLGLGFGSSRWEKTIHIVALGFSHQPIGTAAPIDVRPYPVISVDHAIDLTNELLLLIPIPLLLLIGSVVARPRGRSNPSDSPRAFLTVAAAFGLVVSLALVLPLTFALDWDLFALLLIPAGVLGVFSGLPYLTGRGGSLVGAGLQVAGACTLGAFVLVNALPEAGLRRFETLVGPGAKITPFARTYAREVLVYYYRQIGNPDAAMEYAEALLKEEPTNHRLWAMAGTIRFSQGDFSGAIPYLEEAVARGRRVAGTWTNLGICYAHQGRYDVALSQFTKAATSEPMNPGYQLNLALCLLNAGQPVAARSLMEQIVRRWPNYEPGRRALRRHF